MTISVHFIRLAFSYEYFRCNGVGFLKREVNRFTRGINAVPLKFNLVSFRIHYHQVCFEFECLSGEVEVAVWIIVFDFISDGYFDGNRCMCVGRGDFCALDFYSIGSCNIFFGSKFNFVFITRSSFFVYNTNSFCCVHLQGGIIVGWGRRVESMFVQPLVSKINLGSLCECCLIKLYASITFLK